MVDIFCSRSLLAIHFLCLASLLFLSIRDVDSLQWSIRGLLWIASVEVYFPVCRDMRRLVVLGVLDIRRADDAVRNENLAGTKIDFRKEGWKHRPTLQIRASYPWATSIVKRHEYVPSMLVRAWDLDGSSTSNHRPLSSASTIVCQIFVYPAREASLSKSWRKRGFF